MAEILDALELEQIEIDRVADDVEVGLAFAIKLHVFQLIEAAQQLVIERSRPADARRAVVIPATVEPQLTVHVVTGTGCSNRRQRQAAVDEVGNQRVGAGFRSRG